MNVLWGSRLPPLVSPGKAPSVSPDWTEEWEGPSQRYLLIPRTPHTVPTLGSGQDAGRPLSSAWLEVFLAQGLFSQEQVAPPYCGRHQLLQGRARYGSRRAGQGVTQTWQLLRRQNWAWGRPGRGCGSDLEASQS